MAWIEKRDTKSGIAYYVIDRINGKRVSRPAGPSHKTAEMVRHKMQDESIKRVNGIVVEDKVSLGEAIERYKIYQKGCVSAGTFKSIFQPLRHLLKYFGTDRKLHSISKLNCLEVRDWYLSQYSKNGAICFATRVKAFFSYCVERGLLNSNPASGILKKFPKKPVAVFLNEDEIISLRKACPNQRTRDAVDVALLTGMRGGEVLNLTSAWIRGGSIVPPAQKTKTSRSRRIPIVPALAALIKRNLEENPGKGQDWKIFGYWNDPTALQKPFNAAVKASAKNGGHQGRVRFHDLRHTFASQFLSKGGTLGELMIVLGHTSITTTQIYAHFEQSHIDEKMQRLNYKFLTDEPA